MDATGMVFNVIGIAGRTATNKPASAGVSCGESAEELTTTIGRAPIQRRLRAGSLAAFMLLALEVYPFNGAHCAEWFDNEPANCSGSDSIGSAANALTGGGIKLNAGKGPGRYYTTLDAAALYSFKGPGSESVHNQYNVTPASANNLRSIFESEANNIKVPVFANYGAGLLTGYLPTGGSIAGAIFTYLFSRVDASAAGVHEAGLFVADGGNLYNRTTLLQRVSDKNLFVSASTEYRVSLGKETRLFVINSCLYPASVDVKEFEVAAPLSNPNYTQIVKKQADGSWRVFDTEDRKYIFDPLYYRYQSDGYYYFETEGKELQRISFMGGGWQRMYADERPNGRWRGTASRMIIR